VRTENLIRFDRMTESLNFGCDGRIDISPFEPGCLALQAEEPNWSGECGATPSADQYYAGTWESCFDDQLDLDAT
jgi:hypothetical protein